MSTILAIDELRYSETCIIKRELEDPERPLDLYAEVDNPPWHILRAESKWIKAEVGVFRIC